VGHDLRSPLHALGAAIESLEDGVAADPRGTYAAIHADLTAIRSLVDDLFLLARLESGSLEFERVPVDLTELADEAVEALAPIAAQRDIRIAFRPARRVLTRGGPMQLSRALRNILDNAIKHAPAGSEVIVEVGAQPGRVLILDTGAGFADDMHDRAARGGVVRRVTSALDGTGDTGLGLVIARELAEAHGGRLIVERGPGGRVGIEVPES
jgi:signal transduction histidine kinase